MIDEAKSRLIETRNYRWIPWYRELVKNIVEGGADYLVDKAKQVDWTPSANKNVLLLNFGDEGIDPFSFVYFLASKGNAASEKRKTTFLSVHEVFELPDEMLSICPTQSEIYPAPSFRSNRLFHNGQEFHRELLWKLFRQTVWDDISSDEKIFSDVLNLNGVGVPKLTQCLFLINPYKFSPIDQYVGKKFFHNEGNVENKIKRGGYSAYKDLTSKKMRIFPGCESYEINQFLYLQNRFKFINPKSKIYQLNTDINSDSQDHWQEFDLLSCIITNVSMSKTRAPKHGDVILARFGTDSGHGIGVVLGNKHSQSRDNNEHTVIHVNWINKSPSSIEPTIADSQFGEIQIDSQVYSTFTRVESYRTTLDYVERYRQKSKPHSAKNDDESKTKPPKVINDKFALNTIFYGPPGTGKTWRTVNLSLAIMHDKNIEEFDDEAREVFDDYQFNVSEGSSSVNGRIAFTTFHQNYAYEDFVEGIRPTVGGSAVGFEIRDGIFKKLVNSAKANPNEPYVLIIDEINRGNIAKIFGELITLVEKSKRIGGSDKKEVILPYSQSSFGVPSNLFIIGTMNTADRSIQILDTALRRRFTFIEMMPETAHPKIPIDIDGVNCQRVLESMNQRIFGLLDRERQIGHTYFFDIKTITQLAEVFQNRIIPLLQEYFFDDWSKIKAVLGNNVFVQETKFEDQGLDEHRDSENKYYERLRIDNDGWLRPENYIKIYAPNSQEPESQ